MARIPCSDVKPMMMILNQEHLSCLYSGFKDFFLSRIQEFIWYLIYNRQHGKVNMSFWSQEALIVLLHHQFVNSQSFKIMVINCFDYEIDESPGAPRHKSTSAWLWPNATWCNGKIVIIVISNTMVYYIAVSSCIWEPHSDLSLLVEANHISKKAIKAVLCSSFHWSGRGVVSWVC